MNTYYQKTKRDCKNKREVVPMRKVEKKKQKKYYKRSKERVQEKDRNKYK